jgi:hypothetical protein
MITRIEPPEPPIAEADDSDASENVNPLPRLTVPNVYPEPPELIVVSVPAVRPKDCIAFDATVILMTAPEDVPAFAPSP